MPFDWEIFSFFEWETLWWILVLILFTLSYVGLVVPGIPDAPMMMGGFLVYHFLINDEALSWWFWVTMISLMLLLMSLDWISGGLAAKKLGGSKGTVVAAPIGMLCFFWLPFGALWGPFVTVFALQVYHQKPLNDAVKIAFGTVIGFMSNLVIKALMLTIAKAWFFYLVA